MASKFVSIADKNTLEEWFTRSKNGPVVLFKHSLTCPISANAYDEMTHVGGDVGLVVVQSARDVSREVETRTGVRHESPQALVLRDGEVVWSASHWNVTARSVAEALRSTS